MTSVTTHEFPSLVGGVPVSLDFAPSVLFFVLYALLTLAIVWRIINPRTRTFVLIGTTIFSVERAIVHALRAKAAHDTSFRQNLTLETYFQMVYSGGFLSLGQDLTMLTRTLLVNATEPATDEESASSDKLAGDDFEDHLKIRTWIRRWLGATSIMLWVSFALSIIAGAAYYKQAIRSGTHSALEQQLRVCMHRHRAPPHWAPAWRSVCDPPRPEDFYILARRYGLFSNRCVYLPPRRDEQLDDVA